MSQTKTPKLCNASYYDALSLNLRFFRIRLKLTQDQVAEAAGISTKYLSMIESSAFQHPPTLEVVFRLADVLGVEVFQLFTERL